MKNVLGVMFVLGAFYAEVPKVSAMEISPVPLVNYSGVKYENVADYYCFWARHPQYHKPINDILACQNKSSLSKKALGSLESLINAVEKREKGAFLAYQHVTRQLIYKKYCHQKKFVDLTVRAAYTGILESLAYLVLSFNKQGEFDRSEGYYQKLLELSEAYQQGTLGNLREESFLNKDVTYHYFFLQSREIKMHQAEASSFLGLIDLMVKHPGEKPTERAINFLHQAAMLGDQDAQLTLGFLEVGGYQPLNRDHLSLFNAQITLAQKNQDILIYYQKIIKTLSQHYENTAHKYYVEPNYSMPGFYLTQVIKAQPLKYVDYYRYCETLSSFSFFLENQPEIKPGALGHFVKKTNALYEEYQHYLHNIPMLFVGPGFSSPESPYTHDDNSCKIFRPIITKLLQLSIETDQWSLISSLEKPWTYCGNLQKFTQANYQSCLIHLAQATTAEKLPNQEIHIRKMSEGFTRLSIEEQDLFLQRVKTYYLREDASGLRQQIMDRFIIYLAGMSGPLKEKVMGEIRGAPAGMETTEVSSKKESVEESLTEERKLKKKSRFGKIKTLFPIHIRQQRRREDRVRRAENERELAQEEFLSQSEKKSKDISQGESRSKELLRRRTPPLTRRHTVNEFKNPSISPEPMLSSQEHSMSFSENEREKKKRPSLMRRNTVALFNEPRFTSISQRDFDRLEAYRTLSNPSPEDIKNAFRLVHDLKLANKVRDEGNKIVVTMYDGRAYVIHSHGKAGDDWSKRPAILGGFRQCLKECLLNVRILEQEEERKANEAGEG